MTNNQKPSPSDALQKARERIATIEHDQWVHWSKAVAHEVSSERKKRWEQYWIPYEKLDEETKEYDRVWADKVIFAIHAELEKVTAERDAARKALYDVSNTHLLPRNQMTTPTTPSAKKSSYRIMVDNILYNLRNHPEEWIFDKYTACHKSGVCLWIANIPILDLEVYKPARTRLSLIDRFRVHRAIAHCKATIISKALLIPSNQ